MRRIVAAIAINAAALGIAPAVSGAAPLGSLTTTPAGSVDSSFADNGVASVGVGTWAGASAVAVQPDGAIVTAGQATVNGENVMIATRMTPNGALDTGFGSGGVVQIPINGNAGIDSGAAIAIQPDGKIVIVGTGKALPSRLMSFAAVRLLPDGAPDPAFGTNGIALVPIGAQAIANAVALETDGKIVLGGVALIGHPEFAAVRLNANGSVDPTFGNGGISTLTPNAAAWGVAVQPDGKIVLGGQAAYGASAQQFMAARLNGDGTPDSTFGSGGVVMVPVGSTALGYGVVLQPDGKLVLAGPAYTTKGVAAAVRLNPDGSLDSTFGSNGISTVPDWQGVNGIALDPSGDVLLPAVGPSLIRLLPDGSADQSFGTGGIAQANVGGAGGANGVALQADGALDLGSTANFSGESKVAVVQLAGSPAPANLVQSLTNNVVVPTVNAVASIVGGLVNPPPQPQPSAPPQIIGPAAEGMPLTASAGGWSNKPATISYQWQRCDSTASFCRPVAGATSTNYMPTAFDVGHKLQVLVTATSGGGSREAHSNPTEPITGRTGLVAPSLSHIRLARAATRVAVVTVTASQVGTVRLVVRRHHKVKLRRTYHAYAGRNHFRLSVAHLRAGRYVMTLVIRNVGGMHSRTYTARLRVTRHAKTFD